MTVQENVYKMAITTLSSKFYLPWITFVSIKNSSVSQLPFLMNCHGQEREGKGRAGLGVSRMEKHSWVLLFGRNSAGHPPKPQAGCT